MNKDQIVFLKLTYTTDLVEARVKSVGRKWVHLVTAGTSYRAPIGHPYLDGGKFASPGRIWTSRADYADSEARAAAWRQFRQVVDIHCYAPRGATPENLLKVCGILGISS